MSTQDNKRKKFEEPEPRGARVSPVAAAGALLVVLALTLVYVIASDRGGAPAGQEIAASGTGDVSFPAAQFDDGVARFYTHTAPGGTKVRFFVMKSSDGVIRAAFDACDTCWEDRLGYHQEGDVMVCKKCSRTFRSVDINVLQGGCNPAPIERRVVNGRVVLSAASLNTGAAYF